MIFRSTASRGRPGWLSGPVLAVAGLSAAAGLAAFSVTAVIGDVAATFGLPVEDDPSLPGLGRPVTTIGVALAVIRLASLGSLPLAALADRVGRRRMLVAVAIGGLALTAAAGLAPGLWWYVALVALARPGLAGLNTLAGVVVAEEARAAHRASSIAVITAAYGVGSGIVVVGRALLPGDPSFRVVTAFALVPLLLLPLLVSAVREPPIARRHLRPHGLPGAVPAGLRVRVALLAVLVGGIALATGPGFSYLFVYGEHVLGASPGVLAALVLAAGPAGLLGLLLGRWGADRLGRRAIGALAMVGTGVAAAVAYAGALPALATGYLAMILLASAFAPAQGALVAELVHTAVRGTVAGWSAVAGVVGAVAGLAGFGLLAATAGGFATAGRWLGALTTVCALAFAALPETRGTELETLEEA